MKTFTNSLTKLAILAVVLTGVLAVNYLRAWTGPTATAPNGNTDAPINTGSVAQVKSAALSVDGLTSYSDVSSFFNAAGTQQIDIRPGQKGETPTTDYTTVDVPGVTGTLFVADQIEAASHIKTDNTVAANRFCDENMANCFYPEDTRAYNSVNIKTFEVGDRNGVSWFLTSSKPPATKSVSATDYAYCALGDVRMHSREDTGTDTWNKSCRLGRSNGKWVFEARVTDFNLESIYCKYFCIPQ